MNAVIILFTVLYTGLRLLATYRTKYVPDGVFTRPVSFMVILGYIIETETIVVLLISASVGVAIILSESMLLMPLSSACFNFVEKIGM